MSIGSLIALLAFVLASLGFGFYVANFSNYNKTYGAIGGVIVMLLWLWILNMSLLFGAEFDAEMERGRQLQAGIEAEETIQLPPRDTKKSDKLQEKEEEDIRHGRELREKHSGKTGHRQGPQADSRKIRPGCGGRPAGLTAASQCGGGLHAEGPQVGAEPARRPGGGSSRGDDAGGIRCHDCEAPPPQPLHQDSVLGGANSGNPPACR